MNDVVRRWTFFVVSTLVLARCQTINAAAASKAEQAGDNGSAPIHRGGSINVGCTAVVGALAAGGTSALVRHPAATLPAVLFGVMRRLS